MMSIKCYGGPMHGERVNLDAGCRRFECPVPRLTHRQMSSLYDLAPDLLLGIPPLTHQRVSYFVQPWQQEGITLAGARMRRRMNIGLLDGCEITHREQDDLSFDLDGLPWEWIRKPNFLKEFDQWFEYTYCEVTGKQPVVRHW